MQENNTTHKRPTKEPALAIQLPLLSEATAEQQQQVAVRVYNGPVLQVRVRVYNELVLQVRVRVYNGPVLLPLRQDQAFQRPSAAQMQYVRRPHKGTPIQSQGSPGPVSKMADQQYVPPDNAAAVLQYRDAAREVAKQL